jgi:hypothetical protein
MRIELKSDKVKIYGPKVDGSYLLSFEIGEYELDSMANILKLKQDEIINLTIEQNLENVD